MTTTHAKALSTLTVRTYTPGIGADDVLDYYLYRSRLTDPEDISGVGDIVSAARYSNIAREITGVLLLQQDYVYQYFEGPAASCDLLLPKLLRDPRHQDFSLLVQGVRPDRRLAGTWMAFADLNNPVPPLSARYDRSVHPPLHRLNAEDVLDRVIIIGLILSVQDARDLRNRGRLN